MASKAFALSMQFLSTKIFIKETAIGLKSIHGMHREA